MMAERQTMAKKKPGGRPQKPGGEPVQVRVDAELAEKARYLAAFKRVSMTDYLSGILRPALEKDEKEAAKKMMGTATSNHPDADHEQGIANPIKPAPKRTGGR